MMSLGGLHDASSERDACGVGFVAHVRGEKSRAIVDDALAILARLAHRAATGADVDTGDGAGIHLQLPHRFFKAEALRLGIEVPRRRRYGIGQLFLPAEPQARAACEQIVADVVAEEGQQVLGWREVEIDATQVGPVARAVLPVMRQVYVRMRRVPPTAFERTLFVIRRLIEQRVRQRGVDPTGTFHVASLSTETIVYKGLLRPERLRAFYADLRHPELVSAIAVVHSRFSTNTFPTWDLAQPFRYIAHNGEINTLRGNTSWMEARRSKLQSAKFRGGLDRLQPIIVPGKSDSAQFDNMLELLVLAGRSVPHAMMMMIPEAWEGHADMPDELRAFYRYAASLVEPWDGPAAIVFSDGIQVGATLDRNGLRPARWVRTDDDRVILASEAGVLDLPPERIVQKGRLTPGRMLLVDTALGRIVDDDEIKREVSTRFPYGQWLARNVFEVDAAERGADAPPLPAPLTGAALTAQLRAFGYTDEDLAMVLAPMASTGKEPVGSMGTDTPLAVLSDEAPPLTHYFHQLFAQVTNPPIDPIREALVMTLETNIGPDGNPFDETPEQCHQVRLAGPVLTAAQLAALGEVGDGVLEPVALPMLMPRPPAGADEATLAAALDAALDALCARAVEAIDDGHNLLVLTDRGVDEHHVAIPALLALSAVQQRLVAEGIRMQAGLVIETGDLHEVHDLACLIGYGAAAVHPYLALDAIAAQVARGEVPGPIDAAHGRYIGALHEGLLKVMSKMGISTVQSYRGAKIFEVVGLDRALVQRTFGGTPSRLGGVGLGVLAAEAVARHALGFGAGAGRRGLLPVGGLYSWRRGGERHAWNPDTITALRQAVVDDDRARFAEYERLCDEPGDASDPDPARPARAGERGGAGAARRGRAGQRDRAALRDRRHVVRVDQRRGPRDARHRDEPPRRRSTAARAARSRERYTRADERRLPPQRDQAGRLGALRRHGALPGQRRRAADQDGAGRQARRGRPAPGHTRSTSASPRCAALDAGRDPDLAAAAPRHLLDRGPVAAHLRPEDRQPRGAHLVKLVSEAGVGTVAAGVAKAGADVILVSRASTAARARRRCRASSHAGLPWELGLAEAQQVLVLNGLRGRVRCRSTAGCAPGATWWWRRLLGAEEFGFSDRGAGRDRLRDAAQVPPQHLPGRHRHAGPELRKRFTGEPEHVDPLLHVRRRGGARASWPNSGFRSLDEAGRPGGVLLRARGRQPHLVEGGPARPQRALLRRPTERRDEPAAVRGAPCPHGSPTVLDRALAPTPRRRWSAGAPVDAGDADRNTDRAVGARCPARSRGATARRACPTAPVTAPARQAGQSFGAFLPRGVTLALEGEANDYVGKGLSGGRIVVRPPAACASCPRTHRSSATRCCTARPAASCSRGPAGERFAVRNSRRDAVVEGVRRPRLRVHDRRRGGGAGPDRAQLRRRHERRRGLRVRPRDARLPRALQPRAGGELERARRGRRLPGPGVLDDHVRHTGSELGRRLLTNWDAWAARFVKVMPTEYQRALQRCAQTGERERAATARRRRRAAVRRRC
jgi:glutamate synthase (NADPH/NADH) large chain